GITGLLQQLGKIVLLPIKGLKIVHLSIDKTMLAGQYHSTARRTDGIGDGGSGENCPFLCQPVDVWGFVQTMSIGADGLVGVVVTHDKNNVRRSLFNM